MSSIRLRVPVARQRASRVAWMRGCRRCPRMNTRPACPLGSTPAHEPEAPSISLHRLLLAAPRPTVPAS
eukprot:7390056-Prymnesium_polylepis.1